MHKFPDIKIALQAAVELVEQDREHFSGITLSAIEKETVVPLKFADTLYMQVTYNGCQLLWQQGFEILTAFRNKLHFFCLVQLPNHRPVLAIKTALQSFPLFYQNAVFGIYEIFIKL